MLGRSPYPLLRMILFLFAFLLCPSPGRCQSAAALFARGSMRQVDLGGLKVWLGQPLPFAAQTGWQSSGPNVPAGWSYVHLTPFLARFPRGELVVTYALDPDTLNKPLTLSGFQISTDGGSHWGQRNGVLMQHIPMLFTPKPNNSLLAIASELSQQTPGDEHNFRGPSYLFEQGGKRMVMIPDGVNVVDWPWAADLFPSPQPRESWPVGLLITGNALQVGNRLLATAYSKKKGDKVYSAVLLASLDGGSTWRYFSTVADADPALASQKGYEGPCEMTMVRLAGGDLMAVFRVGSGRKWNLNRAYSHDGGRSWSKPDVLPAYSVEPQVIRLKNGVVALATGRPGIQLWLSSDSRAASWKDIDLVAYHNHSVTDPSFRIASSGNEFTRWQTTSYTGLVEVASNRLLLVYDRDPEGPPAGPNDVSRLFILPIEVERQ